MKHPPRKGDLPREVAMKRASDTIRMLGGPQVAKVFFKFTCPACGERCMFQEPNILYERGTCISCGADEPVEFAGYAVDIKVRRT